MPKPLAPEMNRLRKTLFAGAVILAAVLVFRLMGVTRENRQLAERQRTLVGRNAAAGGKPGTPGSPGSDPGAGPGPGSAAAGSARTGVGPDAEARRRRYDEFRHRDIIRVAWIRYHEAIAKLNLPHEKQAQLLELLRDREEGWFDAKEAALPVGMMDNPLELKQALADARNTLSGKIASLIGDSGLEALDTALALKAQQTEIEGGVGADLAMDGFPLTPEQETALAQIYTDVSRQTPVRSAEGSDPAAPGMPVQQDGEAAVLERASAILTPEQMGGLKAYIDWSGQRAKVLSERPN